MLWLALHLPRLPLEVFQRAGVLPRGAAGETAQAVPFAVTAGVNPPRVMLPDEPALRCGIAPGMALSAAQAIAPHLRTRPRDASLEAAALAGLARWGGQFPPTLSLAPPDALLLEIGGCLRLFGGLAPLLERLRHGVTELGFDPVPASAPTAAGALMLARSGLETHVSDHTALGQRLGQLCIDTLDTTPEVQAGLQRLGLRTLEDCLRLPRDGLARRFGQALLDRMDRALGLQPDPRLPYVAPEHFCSRLVLPVPVPDAGQVVFGLRRLVAELAGFLTSRDAGATRVVLHLEHEDHPPTAVAVDLSLPSRDPAHLLVLLRERIGRVALPGPVEACRLECPETRPLDPRPLSLFPDREEATEERMALVERLRARLGRQAVHGLVPVPEHRPELAFREAEPGSAAPPGPGMQRPVWLLDAPAPMAIGGLRLLQGPERIESGWWDGRHVQRDYYVAALPDGTRLWIYRDRSEAAATPRWFVHGLFG